MVRVRIKCTVFGAWMPVQTPTYALCVRYEINNARDHRGQTLAKINYARIQRVRIKQTAVLSSLKQKIDQNCKCAENVCLYLLGGKRNAQEMLDKRSKKR